jgi:hypothetical protein
VDFPTLGLPARTTVGRLTYVRPSKNSMINYHHEQKKQKREELTTEKHGVKCGGTRRKRRAKNSLKLRAAAKLRTPCSSSV